MVLMLPRGVAMDLIGLVAANQSKTMSQSGTIQAFVRHFCLVREATATCYILLKVRCI